MKYRKPWTMLTVAVVALSAVSVVCFASEEAVKPMQTKGEIVSVDQTAGSLTVKEANLAPTPSVAQPVSFVVDSKTVISKDKQALKLGDLKAGDLVTVEYSTTPDNKALASSVAVETKETSTATP